MHWFQEFFELRRLDKELNRTNELYAKALKEAKDGGTDWQDMASLNHEASWEAGFVYSQIDAIKTARQLRRATRYSVPVPPRSEGDDWSWDTTLGKWLLTDVGAQKLRREIAIEVENRQKPWLNWMSLVISGISLAVAVIAIFK